MPTRAGPRPGFSLVQTSPGRAALDALRIAITDLKQGQPLAPVTVVVPNNFVGISARRAMASGDHGAIAGGHRGLVAVTFATTYRLAELLGASKLAAVGKRPVSTPIIAAAVRRVLNDEPGVFAAVSQHPTTERRLVTAHRELSDLDGQGLEVLAHQSARARDVVRIHQSVARLLDPDWYGEQQLVNAALEAIEAHEDEPLGPLVLFAPERLSPGRAKLLRTIAHRNEAIVVLALTGHSGADATILESAAALGLEPGEAPRSPAPEILIGSVSDADDEVRHAIRGILAAALSGIPFDRMAVIYASDQPYARLLHDHLTTAEIPYNGAAVTQLAESAAGQLLRRLLLLAGRGYRREDVMALVSGSPLRWNGTSVPSRAWEQISRDTGVVKGLADWLDKLTRLIDDSVDELERLGEDPDHEWRVRHLRRRLGWTRSLHSFVEDLSTQLSRGAGLQNWRARAQWSKRLLRRYLAGVEDWPDQEVRALERIEAILDRLATLDGLEADVSDSVFLRTLESELTGGLGRIGSFGSGVLVGAAWMTAGLDLDRVWILGLSEGSFPSRSRDDSLLPDAERAETGVLAQRGARTGDEHRQFLSALGAVAPDGVAHLLRPRGDLRKADERAPSRWLVELAQERSQAHVRGDELDGLDEPWLHHTASFAAGLAETSFPATTQEFDARTLLDHVTTHGSVAGHDLVRPGSSLALGHEMQHRRASRDFTRYDGNLTHTTSSAHRVGLRSTSATALETWARCPYQYFVRYILGVDPLETPELRLRMDPLSRGTLVHTILDRFVSEMIHHDRAEYGWAKNDLARLETIAGEEFQAARDRGLTGEELYWRRDQVLLRRDLHEFFHRDRVRRSEHHLRALATELAFGFRNARPVEVAMPRGDRISIRGSIDLVDVDPDGNLVIIDYKTGRMVKMTEDNPHHRGTKLQLVLYSIAARSILGRADARVTSLYWHLRADAGYALTGYEITDAVEASTIGAIATIVDHIDRGVFVQHPEETTRTQWVSCHYCDPDGLGASDARRRLLRKRSDPALEDYLGLAEPELLAQAQLPNLGAEAPRA